MVSREAEVCFLLFAICQKYDALPLQFDAIENLNWYLRHLLLYGEVSDHAPAIFRVPPIDAPFHWIVLWTYGDALHQHIWFPWEQIKSKARNLYTCHESCQFLDKKYIQSIHKSSETVTRLPVYLLIFPSTLSRAKNLFAFLDRIVLSPLENFKNYSIVVGR